MINAVPQALRFKARSQRDPILAVQQAQRKQENELADRSQDLWRMVSKLSFSCTDRDWVRYKDELPGGESA